MTERESASLDGVVHDAEKALEGAEAATSVVPEGVAPSDPVDAGDLVDLDTEFANGAETAADIAAASEAAQAAASGQGSTTDVAAAAKSAAKSGAKPAATAAQVAEDSPKTEDVAARASRPSAGLRSRTVRRPATTSPSASSTAAAAAAGAVGAAGAAAATPVAVRPVRAPISGLRQKIESTAALRESLDAKEAEAQDLRASIEALRQELDVERTPITTTRVTAGSTTSDATSNGVGTLAPAGSASGNGLRWPMIAGVGVVAVALLFSMTRCGATNASPEPTGASTAATANASAGGASNTAPSSGASSNGAGASSGATAGSIAPVVTPTPRAWKGLMVAQPPDLPTSGYGINQPGTLVSFVLDKDAKTFDVDERVVRAAASADPLILVMPTLFRTPQPAPVDIEVTLDGRAATVTSQGPASWSASSGQPWTKAVVRYRLTDALTVSRAGRADAVMVALTGRSTPMTVVRTTDSAIVHMDCQANPTTHDVTSLCQHTESLAGGGTARYAQIDPSLLPAAQLTVNVPR